MKTKIKKLMKFACMVIVLGTQALLRGSWSVQKPDYAGRNWSRRFWSPLEQIL